MPLGVAHLLTAIPPKSIGNGFFENALVGSLICGCPSLIIAITFIRGGMEVSAASSIPTRVQTASALSPNTFTAALCNAGQATYTHTPLEMKTRQTGWP